MSNAVPSSSGDTAGTPPPIMALRTYASLRLVSVAVIAVLAIAIAIEVYYGTPDDCLQVSISAYYYTPVRSVFVGTLVALGLVMIALWGKTPFEDGVLNLAGLLAPIVAFVPTNDAIRCGIKDATGNQVDTTAEKDKVIEAEHDAIINNLTAYLIIVIAVLVISMVVGIISMHRACRARREQSPSPHARVVPTSWELVGERPLAYWVPWSLALALWIFFAAKFWGDRDWIYDHAHEWAASILFVFIGLVVINVGLQKWQATREREHTRTPIQVGFFQRKPGVFAYGTIAALMVVGFVVVRGFPHVLPPNMRDHAKFLLEAWEILLLAVFWGFQTWDRWDEGAPRRASEERALMIRPAERTLAVGDAQET